MNIWHDIDKKRISPEKFITYIEISKGSKMKYELDKETGLLRLDRVLYTSTHYPANYGFIPRTYASDDDPLDVLVICQEVILSGCMVEVYPIGLIKMIDDKTTDEKIIAIPFSDPAYSQYKDISELPKHMMEEFTNFFETYKSLEGKKTYILDVLGKDEAIKCVTDSINAYKKKFKG